MAIEMVENEKNKINMSKREQLCILLILTVTGILLIIYGYKFVTYFHGQLIIYILGLSMIIIGISSWVYRWIELC